jgi:acetyl esterase/lipase
MKNYFRLGWFVSVTGLLCLVYWLLVTQNPNIWPVRNTLHYYTLKWWWEQTGYPAPGQPGGLRGVVRNQQGQPVAGAWVLAARWNGETFSTRSDNAGHYHIDNLPADSYRPVAGAPGYDDILPTGDWGWLTVNPNTDTSLDITLPNLPPRPVTPGANLNLGKPQTISCPAPLSASAVRQEIHFDSGGQPNQPAFYYTPITTTTASRLPALLVVYPGPADSWECASLPLSAAGYAVIALGPAYSLDLEADVDEIERVVKFVREGQLPGSSGDKLALLGGSYSTVLVMRLLERTPQVEAAVLLGPPTDLFDMRRRLEEDSFIPPFGLDKVLVALGLPNREPLNYWRYSNAYHLRPDLPPLVIMHSRTDEVVPYQQSDLLAANLKQLGIPHAVHFFDGASHYLMAPGSDADTLKIYQITLDFLAENLQ